MGLTQVLPASLEEALEAFETDREWAEETWGKDYVKWFLILKRHELPQIAKMDAIVRRQHFVTYF
jgi:glutamine synthetase